MKNICTEEDCREVRCLINERIRTASGPENCVLLSGGIDSAAVLFSCIDTGIKYRVVNFRFRGIDSIDTNSVKALQQKIGFMAEYLELDPECDEDIREAARLCVKTFGRVRKVKCETIYAMLQVRRHIPETEVILCGYGGDDLLGYSRNDALEAARNGEESILERRRLPQEKDEFRAAFSGRNYFSPYVDPAVQEKITEFTTKACNAKFPKSILVRAFGDYFRKYKNARKPIGLHKGSCEAVMFEETAQRRGFRNALEMFSSYVK